MNFFDSSSKRNFVLTKILKGQLSGFCETRWIERHDAVIQFQTEINKVKESLLEISNWEECSSASKAKSLCMSICDTEFVVTLVSMSDVFALTLPFSKLLQKKELGLQSATNNLNTMLVSLSDKRQDCITTFAKLFKDVERIMKDLEVEVTLPRLVSKQTKRANPPADTPEEYFRRAIYIPLLDSILVDLKDRFKSGTLNSFGISSLIPNQMLD